MKNFTQKFIGLLALVFTMSFTINAQDNYSLNLDGVGDHVVVNPSLSLDTISGFSVGGWFNIRSIPSGAWNPSLLAKLNTDGNLDSELNVSPEGFALQLLTETFDPSYHYSFFLMTKVNGQDRYLNVVSESTFLENEWTHIMCTYSNGNAKIFINGVLNNESNWQYDLTIPDNQFFTIGADIDDLSTNGEMGVSYTDIPITLDGSVDDVLFYNIELSSEQIQSLMSCGPSQEEEGLVGYWDFNQLNEDLLIDISGNGNNGIIHGGATYSEDVPEQDCENLIDTIITLEGHTYIGEFENSIYYISNDISTWEEANEIAANFGGHLVTISSEEENQFIWNAVYNQGYNPGGTDNYQAWIGLYQNTESNSYQEPSGGWQWVNGEEFSYSNWASHEPDNSDGGYFAHISDSNCPLNGGSEDNQCGTWCDDTISSNLTSAFHIIEYKYGCTDSEASNYDETITLDDGSCQYSEEISDIEESQNNYSLDFVGENKFIEVPSADIFNITEEKDFSISTWFKIDSNNLNQGDYGMHALISHALTEENNIGWQLGVTHDYGGSIVFHITNGDSFNEYLWAGEQKEYFDNYWHNIVVTLSQSNGTIKLFIDEENKASWDGDLNVSFSNDANLLIGIDRTYNNSIHSKIYDIQIWEKELSLEEIQSYNMCPPTGDEEGIVGFWDFNEGIGDTVYDISGNNNHGVVYGGAIYSEDVPEQNCDVNTDIETIEEEQQNYSMSFDGESSFIDLGQQPLYNLESESNYSIQIDIKPNDVEKNQRLIAYGATNQPGAYQICLLEGKLRFSLYNTDYLSDVGLINSNVWQTITVSKQGNLYKVFNNEIEILSFINNESDESNSNSLYLGLEPTAISYYDGFLDNVKIWNIGLSYDEILSYKNCPPIGSEDGLLGYWNFNEGYGDTVYDITGNGNHGVIYGVTFSEDVPEQNCDLNADTETVDAEQQDYSLSFDGIDDWVEINSFNTDSDIDLTIHVCAMGSGTFLSAKTNSYQTYFNYDNTNLQNQIVFHNGQANTNTKHWNVSNYDDLSSGFQFYSLTLNTENGNTISELFLNGISLGEYIFPNPVLAYTEIEIGRNIVEQNGHFDGVISEIQIWDGVLSQEQIQSLICTSYIGEEETLLGYWNFNEGIGDTIYDLSGNNNHGLINGASFSEDIPENNCSESDDNINNSVHEIGDFAEGGVIFYIDESGTRGLVATMEDLEGIYEWGCYQEYVDGADGTSIGTGYQNTMDIVTQGCTTLLGGITAAQAALDSEINGYSDWHLPSKDELLEMFNSIENEDSEGNLGGFYWSSSENNVSNNAWIINFLGGNSPAYTTNKNNMDRVRPIRAFGDWTMGCMDETACNYNAEANMGDGSCTYAEQVYDCDGNLTAEIEEPICGYLPTGIDIWPYVDITIPDGYKVQSVYADFDRPGYYGAQLDFSIAYCSNCDLFPVFNDNLTDFLIWNYDTIPYSLYDTELVISEVSEIELNGPGTIRVLAPLPYDGWNNFCVTFRQLIYGCMDSLACNYNPEANMTDGSCTYPELFYDCSGELIPVLGCLNSLAINYDELATVEDGSCLYSADVYLNLLESNSNLEEELSVYETVEEEQDYSMSFDGIDDYINCGSNINISNSFSISSWVYVLPNGANYTIASKREMHQVGNSDYYNGFHFTLENDESGNGDDGLRFVIANNSQGDALKVISPIPYNQWNYVVGVFDAQSSIKLYINGSLADSINTNLTSIGSLANSQDLLIGAVGYSPGILSLNNYMDGHLNEATLWSFPLTQQQIQSYMTCPPTGQEEGLVGYWNFNEGSGDIVYDLSGNGNHGVIYGAEFSEDVPESYNGCADELALNYDESALCDNGSCVYGDDLVASLEDENSDLEGSLSVFETVQEEQDYSMSFDGVNDFINISSFNEIQLDSFSYMGRFKTNGPNGDEQPLINTPNGIVSLFNDANCLWAADYENRDGDDKRFRVDSGLVNDNQIMPSIWYSFAYIVNDTNSLLYINDVLVDNSVIEEFIQGTYNLSQIGSHGRSNSPSTGFFNGEIDDISIWNSPLSIDQVQSYMSCPPTGSEEGLVGYWNFNEGTGDTVYDISGNGNHGVIYGAEFSEDVPESLNGCTDANALNYDESALCDNGSCVFADDVLSNFEESFNQTVSSLNNELDSTNSTLNNVIDTWQSSIDLTNATLDEVSDMNQTIASFTTLIDLQEGWNMIGYGCPETVNIEQGMSMYTDLVLLIKDNNGSVYLPEFNFNGIGDFTPGYGYQLKVSEPIEDFGLCGDYTNTESPEITDIETDNAQMQNDINCLTGNPEIGDHCYGGIVFYVEEGEEGKYGYVISLTEQDPMSWYDAMEMAENSSEGNFNNWTLPNEEQCDLIFSNIGIGSETQYLYLQNTFYWMSLEESEEYAHDYSFVEGNYFGAVPKSNDTNYSVVIVRSFGNWTLGCMDSSACNYNPEANMADGSCVYPEQGYDCEGNITAQIGEVMEGGYLFYIDSTGKHGLVAAMEDLTEGATNPFGWVNNGYEWGCYSENVSGADGQAIGTGYQNTMDIVSQGCVTENGGITAAQAALDAEVNGYIDWYLPSIDELNVMYNTIGPGGLESNTGGFEISVNSYYWSSSEINNMTAWGVYFDNGDVELSSKNNTRSVRVIRSF